MGDLTTLAEVKQYLGGTIPDTLNPVLQALISAASDFVVNYCGRTFDPTTQTEYYDGTGTARLMLRKIPVLEVNSVLVSGQVWELAYWPNSGYQFDEYGLVAVANCGVRVFDRGSRNVSVTYKAGFVTVPSDLKQAVNEMVADKFKRRDNIGVYARQIAQETITYTAGDVPKSALSVLNLYQRAATTL